MTRVYQRDGALFWPSDSDSLAVHPLLPAGTYSVNLHPKNGYYLERVADFKLPSKIYGDTQKRAERILNTFTVRSAATGVLLTGQKGSGKTLLSKCLAVWGYELGMVTLLVNQPFHGETFNSFISGITQPATVLFDEFEKVYAKREKQADLLTLFDGTHPSKKLYILTVNDRSRVDSHLVNRPGRMYYSIDYKGLALEFIREYCADNLKNNAELAGLVLVTRFFSEFSFDMLQALVEEMNRYDESAEEAIKLLNLSATQDTDSVYCAVLVQDEQVVPTDDNSHDRCLNPMGLHGQSVAFYGFDATEAHPPGALFGHLTVKLDTARLRGINGTTGTFDFGTDKSGQILRFVRATQATSDAETGLFSLKRLLDESETEGD